MMAQHLIWLGSFVIFQGIRTIIAKKPYIFMIFQGGGVGPPAPPTLAPHPAVDPCMSYMYYEKNNTKHVRVDITSIHVNAYDNCCRYMIIVAGIWYATSISLQGMCVYSWTLVDIFLEA